jgi:2,3-bisphosphoglycerate-dependent phosphoglycerate mutase
MCSRLFAMARAEWNKLNLFTGWRDPDLTETGILNKDDARKKWGEEQVHIWRRSYDAPPPGGESLKDTAARVPPYYESTIPPQVLAGKNVLVSAHGNSLRALIMQLDKLSPEEILKLNLPTGEPYVYRLNADGSVASKATPTA